MQHLLPHGGPRGAVVGREGCEQLRRRRQGVRRCGAGLQVVKVRQGRHPLRGRGVEAGAALGAGGVRPGVHNALEDGLDLVEAEGLAFRREHVHAVPHAAVQHGDVAGLGLVPLAEGVRVAARDAGQGEHVVVLVHADGHNVPQDVRREGLTVQRLLDLRELVDHAGGPAHARRLREGQHLIFMPPHPSARALCGLWGEGGGGCRHQSLNGRRRRFWEGGGSVGEGGACHQG